MRTARTVHDEELAAPAGRLPDPDAHGARRARRWSTSTPGRPRRSPARCLDAERDFYEQHNAAVHRGAHQLWPRRPPTPTSRPGATIAGFIGARGRRGRLHQERHRVAQPRRPTPSPTPRTARRGPAPLTLGPGDEVLVTEMEHHANLVPWQELCRRTGATLRWVPCHRRGRLDLDRPRRALLTDRTKVFAFTHVSNVLGTVNPVAELADAAQRRRGPRRARRLPVGAAPAGRRRRPGCRLRWPSPATRCSARPASASSGAGRTCSTRCRRSSRAAR